MRKTFDCDILFFFYLTYTLPFSCNLLVENTVFVQPYSAQKIFSKYIFTYVILFSLKTYIFQVVPVKYVIVGEALSVEQISEIK